MELLPDPDRRLTLSGERDALGMPRLNLAMTITDDDFARFRLTLAEFGRQLLAAKTGMIHLSYSTRGEWLKAMDWGNHHLGTTRMHDDPKHGVVDADSKVHGVGNLYVAGSSVFPTYGSSNPTLKSGGPDLAAGRSSEKGDGMRRRGVLGGVVAAMVAAGGAAWRLHLFGPHYPPTPYDDLLNQISDREPARVFGEAALKTMPNKRCRQPGAGVARPRHLGGAGRRRTSQGSRHGSVRLGGARKRGALRGTGRSHLET